MNTEQKQPEAFALRLASWLEAYNDGEQLAIDNAATELRRLHELNAELLDALQEVLKLAIQAHDHWQNDQDAKVGKILLALSGHLPRYDKRIDAIHATLAKAEGGAK